MLQTDYTGPSLALLTRRFILVFGIFYTHIINGYNSITDNNLEIKMS